MNWACRLLGHQWVRRTKNPKTDWELDEKGEIVREIAEEPRTFEECARCDERRDSGSRAQVG